MSVFMLKLLQNAQKYLNAQKHLIKLEASAPQLNVPKG
jgi:hypothetical protein